MTGARRAAGLARHVRGRRERRLEVAGRRLRQLPVLAEPAAQRAARRAERERAAARQEVVEGLLLDRVDVHRGRAAVDQAAQLAVDVRPGAALPALAGADVAALRAEQAANGCRGVRVGLGGGRATRVARGAVGARERRGRPVAGLRGGVQEILARAGEPLGPSGGRARGKARRRGGGSTGAIPGTHAGRAWADPTPVRRARMRPRWSTALSSEVSVAVTIDVEYVGDLHCEAAHGPSGNRLVTDAPVDNGGKGETVLADRPRGDRVRHLPGHDHGDRRQAARMGPDRHPRPRRQGNDVGAACGASAPSRRPSQSRQARVTAAADRVLLERGAETCPVRQSLHPDVKVTMVFEWDARRVAIWSGDCERGAIWR